MSKGDTAKEFIEMIDNGDINKYMIKFLTHNGEVQHMSIVDYIANDFPIPSIYKQMYLLHNHLLKNRL